MEKDLIMKIHPVLTLTLVLILAACNVPSSAPTNAPTEAAPAVEAATATALEVAAPTETAIPPTPIPPTETFTPTLPPPTASSTSTPTEIPTVDSLKAVVTADTLSCRYGPGAEYLYFYGFRKDFKLTLIGRAHASNWVMVDGLEHKCWVNQKFISVEGDPQTLRVTYPGEYELPESPYYAPPAVLSAENNGGTITVKWTDVELRAGDEEDADMFIYIIEVWRCEGGQIVFEALASNYPEVTFVDEGGCAEPSHGRVFFQEKHGFAGPAEIPWP